MSDAWAIARYAHRESLIADLRQDPELQDEIRREVMKSSKLQKMSAAALELYPRKAGKELQTVLESRVESMVTLQMHRLLDEEIDPANVAESNVRFFTRL